MPFLGSVMTKDWVHRPFSSMPDLIADCRESGDYIPSTCLDQFCWDVFDSSRLPFLQWLYCNLHFFAKDGVVILCVCLGTVQYWQMSVDLVIVQLSAVFCPSVQYLSFFCEAFSWTILDSSSFPLFHSGQVFHELIRPVTVVLPQVFLPFPWTSWCCCSHAVRLWHFYWHFLEIVA